MAHTTTHEGGVTLGTPLLDKALRDINFFNGRLLTGGDLQREQQARRGAERRVGAATGPGIAWGLEVERAAGSEKGRVTVKAGLGVSASGEVLHLATNPVLHLVAPPPQVSASVVAGFGPCGSLPGASFLAGGGVFLLTLAPITVAEGKAPVLALDAVNTRCATDAYVQALQFRLVRINGFGLSHDSATAVALLRNRLAYAFFAAKSQADAHASPGTAPVAGLPEEMLKLGLSDCDVPLAVLVLQDEAVVFVDSWAVRRRIAAGPASKPWAAWLGERVCALGEAQMAQFQQHILDTPDLLNTAASNSLAWLPPAGFLPDDARWQTFLGTRAAGPLVPLAAADAPDVLAGALRGDAIALAGSAATDGLRMYRVTGSGQLLFVRDGRNLHHAQQIWLDGAPAGLPGIHDVQAAIEVLGAGTCLHVVMRPSMPESKLASMVDSLAGRDVHLCFEPGRYKWRQHLRLAGLGHVQVHGAGAHLVNTEGSAALRIVNCAAVEVHGLSVEGAVASSKQYEGKHTFEGALTVLNTPRVHIEGVRAICSDGRKAKALATALWVAFDDTKLMDAGPTRVSVVGCEMEVAPWQQGIFISDADATRVLRNRQLPYQGKADHQIGIYIGGRMRGLVQVDDNLLRGVAYGIEVHVAFDGKAEGAERATGRVGLAGNRIVMSLAGAKPENLHAVKLSTARSVSVQRNEVTANEKDAAALEFGAVQLEGTYGPQVLVRDNLFEGCPVGIIFDPQETPPYFAWAFQCNVALGQQPEVLIYPESLVEQVVDENNVPQPKNLR